MMWNDGWYWIRGNGFYWTYSEFSDGPLDMRQDAFLDCQAFVECELDEMTEVKDEY